MHQTVHIAHVLVTPDPLSLYMIQASYHNFATDPWCVPRVIDSSEYTMHVECGFVIYPA